MKCEHCADDVPIDHECSNPPAPVISIAVAAARAANHPAGSALLSPGWVRPAGGASSRLVPAGGSTMLRARRPVRAFHRSRLAVAGLVLAIVLPFVGLVMSMVALAQIERSTGVLAGRGFAFAGIAIGASEMVAFSWILFFITIVSSPGQGN